MKQPSAEDLRPRDARAAAVGAQPLHRLRDGPRDDAVPRALRDRARGQEDERTAQGRNSIEEFYLLGNPLWLCFKFELPYRMVHLLR